MAKKVKVLGVKKEEYLLYFLGKVGDVYRIKMTRGRRKTEPKVAEKIVTAGIERKPGYLYFIDKDGDISCVQMAREERQNSLIR